MSTNANCYVCDRGFPSLDLLEAHMLEHPGRTVEEIRRGREAYGRLRGTDKTWIDVEAAHNDSVEVTTEHPGVAVNEALAKLTNRQKLAAVGGKKLAAPHFPLYAGEHEPAVETGLVPDDSPLDPEGWEQHDKMAQAQRLPHAQLAANFAARHLYEAREIPYAEAVGNRLGAEMARRNDFNELSIAQEREHVLSLAEEAPETDEDRRALKERLVEERRQESLATFVEQFPEEAKRQGVKAPKLPKETRAAINRQKTDADREINQRRKDSAPQPGEPIANQFNEPHARGEAPAKPSDGPSEEDKKAAAAERAEAKAEKQRTAEAEEKRKSEEERRRSEEEETKKGEERNG